MSEDIWHLFPYPTITTAGITDGSLLPAHPDCVTCPNRMCLTTDVAGVAACRYGLSFSRVDHTRVVAGVVAAEASTQKRAKRRLKKEPARRVTSEQLINAIRAARALGPGLVEDFERDRADAVARVAEDPELHKSVASFLRKDFEETLNRSHDFMQLVKLVRGHAEQLLSEKLPHLAPELAAEQLETEGAIYFSTELMLAKMDSLTFLREPNLALGDERNLRIHPMILKYARIYRWQAGQKGVSIRLGECYTMARYNRAAMGAVVQGLIDNLVKYSPAGSRTRIDFEDVGQRIVVTFRSLGPRISAAERENIFLPGYRGVGARALGTARLGAGLAAAKQISDVLGLELRVDQAEEPDVNNPGYHSTEFSISLRKSAEQNSRELQTSESPTK